MKIKKKVRLQPVWIQDIISTTLRRAPDPPAHTHSHIHHLFITPSLLLLEPQGPRCEGLKSNVAKDIRLKEGHRSLCTRLFLSVEFFEGMNHILRKDFSYSPRTPHSLLSRAYMIHVGMVAKIMAQKWGGVGLTEVAFWGVMQMTHSCILKCH